MIKSNYVKVLVMSLALGAFGCTGLFDDDLDAPELNSSNPCLLTVDGLDCVDIIIDPIGGGNTDPEWNPYFYTHKGESNNNIYWGATADSTNWYTGQLNSGQTSEGPATVFFNDELFIYYKGNSTENIFYSVKSTPTSFWQGNSWINTGSKTKRHALSATVHNGMVWLAYVGANNDELYLAYSSDGRSFTQIDPQGVGTIGRGNVTQPKEYFTITSSNGRLYIIQTAQWGVNNSSGVNSNMMWRYTTDPTDPNAWTIANGAIRGDFTPYTDSPNVIETFNGLSATSLNNEIYIAFGFASKNCGICAESTRRVAWAKLTQAHTVDYVRFAYDTKRRPGITYSDDGHLFVAYTDNSQDKIKVFKFDSDDGDPLINPFESGGEAKVGGVQITSLF